MRVIKFNKTIRAMAKASCNIGLLLTFSKGYRFHEFNYYSYNNLAIFVVIFIRLILLFEDSDILIMK